jgi:phosphate-selective porin OprO and OprP
MKKCIRQRNMFSRIIVAVFVLVLIPSCLLAANDPPSPEDLLKRINDLEQKLNRLSELEQEVKELKAQLEKQKAAPAMVAAPAQATNAAVAEAVNPNAVYNPKAPSHITAGSEGLVFTSSDSNFVIGIHGLLQMDSRTFPSDDKALGNDTFLLRRARPILSGTVYRDFDFLFTPEFGGNTVQILDALVNYRYSPEFQLQLGKMKPPVGLEAQEPEEAALFNERSLATDLVPYRDIGAELHGNFFGGSLTYAAGVFNGSPDYLTTTTNNNFDNNKSFDGRIYFQPWSKNMASPVRGLGFGVAGTVQKDAGTTNSANGTGLTQGYTTDALEKFFTYSNSVASTGLHDRITPQAFWSWGPAQVMSEYVIDNDHVSNFAKKTTSADLQNTAWEISGGYVLTGEDASYYGVKPAHPFSPHNGQWGALQLVGRFADLHIDKNTFAGYADPNTSASEADAWAVGLNWYLNNNLRINASFSRTTFEGGNGPKATVTKQPEEVFFTRFQLVF